MNYKGEPVILAEPNFTPSLKYDPFIVTTGGFLPGQSDAFCEKETDPLLRELAKAELSYFRGETAAANAMFKRLAEEGNERVALAGTLGMAIASLSGENVFEIIRLYNSIKTVDSLIPEDNPFKKTSDTLMLFFNILLHNSAAIRFPPVGPDAFSVPDSLKPMAFYAYTRYLIETGDVGRAVGMAEGAIIFMHKPCPISEIYLNLIICRGYMLRKLWDKAEFYFRYAWSVAQPDGLIMPFAEHRGMLSGMLEKCLRYEESAAYKRILELSNRYQSSWVTVHNELTGDRISDALTAIEFNVASLASKGCSNNEIADLLGITVNSVRAHLRNIFNKLGIDSRKELYLYVM